jgi:hypothetical protein
MDVPGMSSSARLSSWVSEAVVRLTLLRKLSESERS